MAQPKGYAAFILFPHLKMIPPGASAEAKMPTGSELKRSIARVMNIRDDCFNPRNVDPKISLALSIIVTTGKPYAVDMELLLNAAEHIHHAMPQALSIDSFIDSHNGNKEI